MTNVKIAGETPYINAQCMAVRKDWAPLAGILQKTLDSISETERAAIYYKWVPIRYEHGFNYNLLWKALAVFAVVLAGLAAWNYKLSGEIRYRKKVEAALSQSEERLRMALEGAADGIWDWNLQMDQAYYSPRNYTMLGYCPEEFPATHERWRELIHPEDRAAVEKSMQDGIASHSTFIVEFRLKAKAGGWQWIERRGKAVELDRDGNPVRLAGSHSDITVRKQTEKALLASYSLRDKIADQMPGVIYQYLLYPDGKSCFPYASSGMNDIYEVTPEEVREDASPVFPRLHPDDYGYVVGAIQESAKTLQHFHCEFRVLLPRQGLRWRLSDAQPERMEDGSILWHGIIIDITERKQAEEERDKLQEQLLQAQKMESVGRLAGGIAHDFNNMLGVILGYTDMAMQFADPPPPLTNYLQEILKAAQRSADLTRQLLAFARKQTVSPRVVDLNDKIPTMLKMLQRLIGENIELVWKPGNALWPIRIDPSRLIRSLLIFLSMPAMLSQELAS